MKPGHEKYIASEIGPAYNKEMLNILGENPNVSAGLSLCFDRKPDMFKKVGIKYHPAIYAGFFKENKLYGFGAVGFYKAFINGKPQTAYYLFDGCVSKPARKKGYFPKASRILFEKAFENSIPGYTIVLKGNKNAESYLSKQFKDHPFVPHYKLLAPLDARSIIITFPKKESKNFTVRKATLHDTDAIVSLLKEEFSKRQFAPYIDKKIFLKNLSERPDFDIGNYYIAEKEGKIEGVCAAWDCSSFKQTRVVRYGRKLKITKALFTFLSWLFNFPPLPKKGDAFKEIFITDYAIRGRAPSVLKALLLNIYNEHRKLKYNSIIFGSYQTDPLFEALRGFFSQSVKSHFVLLSHDRVFLDSVSDKTSKPYVDMAFL